MVDLQKANQDMTYEEWKKAFVEGGDKSGLAATGANGADAGYQKDVNLNDKADGRANFYKGDNTIFEGKTPIEKCEIAREITSEYVFYESKWSGKVIVDDDKCKKQNISGRKEWNCNILVKSTTKPKTYIHEMLHSMSGSYLNPIQIIKYKKMEEASTELLAREICKKQKISYGYSIRDDVMALYRINDILKLEEDDLLFSQVLYNKGIKRRYEWLKGKVDEYLKANNGQNKEELKKCLAILR